jgi:hypothetical protein
VEQQLKLERETPDKMDLMITDSPVFLAFVYSTLMVNFRRLDKKDIIMLDRIYDKVLDHGGYDMVFLLPVLWQPADDGVRPEGLRSQNGTIDLRIQSFISLHGIQAQNLVSAQPGKREILNEYADFAEDMVLAIMRGANASKD